MSAWKSMLIFMLLLDSFIVSYLSNVAAEERIALLIGNQNYKEKVGTLKNPVDDVQLLAPVLEKLGFKVTMVKDAGYKAIDTALKTHIQQVRRSGKNAVSFFYYSGHGASDPETRINYLIPVDVESADDAELWTNSFELNDIVSKLRNQAPDATHYVVFDACREELRLTRQGKKALGSEKGFSPVSTVSGVMIAYATAPGRTASDAGQKGGPYAIALADEIGKRGIEAVTMFRNVQLRVKQTISQDPWLSFPTLPPIYFAGPQTDEEIEMGLWSKVKDSHDPAELSTYLTRYPDGQFALIGRALVAHYEQQAKAERARVIEQQRQEEEARKAAEMQRLAVEQRVREAEIAARQREADEKNNLQAAAELTKQQVADTQIYAEKMRKAQEDVRIARETAKAAEDQRTAAVKAADEASKAAEAAIAAKRASAPSDDKIIIAAIPDIKAPEQSFDGNWTFRNSSETCKYKGGSFSVVIRGATVTLSQAVGQMTGKIDPSGEIRWTSPGRMDGTPIDWTGKLRGESGSGTYTRRDRKCSGVFTAQRN